MISQARFTPDPTLAMPYGGQDPSGWLACEKFDGVRAVWSGSELVTRAGNPIHAPSWYRALLPAGLALDGELWIGRRRFDEVSAIVRGKRVSDAWESVTFMVFDLYGSTIPRHSDRMDIVRVAVAGCRNIIAAAHEPIRDAAHMDRLFESTTVAGGEGLVLRVDADGGYQHGRSASLLKLKPEREVDGTVSGYRSGTGRNTEQVGSLVCVLASGVSCAVGSGLPEWLRRDPPPIGSTVRITYQELTPGGVPRFPRFAGIRCDAMV